MSKTEIRACLYIKERLVNVDRKDSVDSDDWHDNRVDLVVSKVVKPLCETVEGRRLWGVWVCRNLRNYVWERLVLRRLCLLSRGVQFRPGQATMFGPQVHSAVVDAHNSSGVRVIDWLMRFGKEANRNILLVFKQKEVNKLSWAR